MNPKEEKDEILTYKDLAQFKIKLNTAYTLVSQNRIPHIRLGRRFVRFSKKSIETWMEQNEVKVLISAIENQGLPNEK